MAVKEAMVPQFIHNSRPSYREASQVPKEENRAVSMVWVLEDDHHVCNQCGQCCVVAQGNP